MKAKFYNVSLDHKLAAQEELYNDKSKVTSLTLDYHVSQAQQTRTNSESQSIEVVMYANKKEALYLSPKLMLNYYFDPEDFLMPERPETQFIEDAQEIQAFVEQTFRLTTGRELPQDIIISLCAAEEMKDIIEAHNSHWSDGIQGFAINRKPFISNIFIRKDALDKVMLVVGHEIGHVLSMPLKKKHDEEAKAFAFSLAWMEAIKQHNIADLSNSIKLDKPTQNGLHNVALDFVLNLVKTGKKASEIYSELINNVLSI